MYRALALLQPSADVPPPAVAARLRERFPQYQIELTGDEISLSDNSWDYHLKWEAGPDVQADSEHLGERISGADDDADIAACDRRIVLSSDTPDPFVEHFDKHFQVLDVLRAYPGVILVDPSEPGLL